MHAKFLFGFFIACSLCLIYVNAQKVPITVYYESLCPDSRRFFTTQLYPTLQTNLSKWVNLTLVPYGKSNQTQLAGDQWQFSCHHGPYECQGNKIQACALHEIETTSPKQAEQGFNPTTLRFINCLMDKTEKKTDPTGADQYTFPIKNCSEINHIQNYAGIENCAQHTTGSKYLLDLGIKTKKFQENLVSVPTIVFNDKYQAEESKAAEVNLIKVLCKYITKDKPEECKNCGVTFTSSLLVFALIVVKSLF
ncbi:hypothetical protein RN001_011057 [Aquatica leii]|uniref:Gamma-interferon-inducible lysosomal thiol reductase n=1 Tax=Aquatica leii TaxID=1421715 RepID=A0AAN7S8T5_9COLE|nr:hypothetical protein RN001_011057 [Aquatica leii]